MIRNVCQLYTEYQRTFWHLCLAFAHISLDSKTYYLHDLEQLLVCILWWTGWTNSPSPPRGGSDATTLNVSSSESLFHDDYLRRLLTHSSKGSYYCRTAKWLRKGGSYIHKGNIANGISERCDSQLPRIVCLYKIWRLKTKGI